MADHNTDPGYETRDAQVGPFFKVGVLLVVIMAVSFFGMVILFKVLNYYQPLFDDPVPPMAETRQLPDGPRLQVDPPKQKFALRTHEEEILGSYAWIDLTSKRVRIPVERAITLVSEGQLSLEQFSSTAAVESPAQDASR